MGRREEGMRVEGNQREGGKSGFGKQIEGKRAWKGTQRMIRRSRNRGGADKQAEEGKKRWKEGNE